MGHTEGSWRWDAGQTSGAEAYAAGARFDRGTDADLDPRREALHYRLADTAIAGTASSWAGPDALRDATALYLQLLEQEAPAV